VPITSKSLSRWTWGMEKTGERPTERVVSTP
jgi:hypothetical protein